jgi:hypothetical protein
MLRSEQLCPGPGECPEVLMMDPMAGADALPCPECPRTLLAEYLASPGGRLISVVIDLDFALQAGMSVDLGQVPYPEFLLLRQLIEERDKFQIEEMEKRTKQQN